MHCAKTDTRLALVLNDLIDPSISLTEYIFVLHSSSRFLQCDIMINQSDRHYNARQNTPNMVCESTMVQALILLPQRLVTQQFPAPLGCSLLKTSFLSVNNMQKLKIRQKYIFAALT